MNRLNKSCRGSDQCVYEIWLDGCLDPRWANWFGATDVRCHGHSHGQDQTVLLCPVADQAALYGVLRKVRDLGLSLAAVKRVGRVLSSE